VFGLGGSLPSTVAIFPAASLPVSGCFVRPCTDSPCLPTLDFLYPASMRRVFYCCEQANVVDNVTIALCNWFYWKKVNDRKRTVDRYVVYTVHHDLRSR
jgi:hypothetical protein